MSLLAPGGVLAVQMPAMHDAPLRALQPEIAASGPWAEAAARHRLRALHLPTRGRTGICCGPTPPLLDMWQTIYMHALQGEDAVAEWAAGSSLRPFLDALPDDNAHSRFAPPTRPRCAHTIHARPDGTSPRPSAAIESVADRGSAAG